MRFAFAMILLVLCAAARGAEPALPALLADWRDWVLHDEPFRRCPFAFDQEPDDAGAFDCVLPGGTRIAIDAGVATVESEVWLFAADYVPLIGAANASPDSLSVDASAAVIEPGPRTWLTPGRHQLRYRLPAPPGGFESLEVPDVYRLIALRVDGKDVFPLNREGTTLWLSRAAVGAERDALEIEVHRLWRDASPQELTTELTLHIAGKSRELRLGPAWPSGYELTAIDADLPVVVEAERRLRVQATAGRFKIRLQGRALAPADELAVEAAGEPWASSEVWSFAAVPQLRAVDVQGAAPVDPNQSNVPDSWLAYPAFVLSAGESLSLRERSRGLGESRNRISLAREMWLDFDGRGYSISDRLSGELRERFRLNLASPFELTSASERGEPLLVTGLANDRGIEVRYPRLDVQSTARLPRADAMPAHGWSERLDRLSIALNLPPGVKLLHASGPDRVSGSWIAQWSIYTVFIAALLVSLAWRVGGVPLAAAVGLLSVLGAHDDSAPRYSLLALLLSILLLRAISATRLRPVLLVLSAAMGLVVAAVALPFAFEKARHAMHPQLDMATSEMTQFANDNRVDVSVMEAANAPASMDDQELDRVVVTGTRIERSVAVPQSPAMGTARVERYAKDAVIQAGNARVNWKLASEDASSSVGTAAASLEFDGPVAREQQLRLWLSPPWFTALWNWLLVASIALIAVFFWRGRHRPLPVVLLAACLMSPAAPAETPSPELLDELQERLTEPPPCAGQCATIPRATLTLDGERFVLQLDVHAAARVLVPIPIDDNAIADALLRVDGEAAPLALDGVAPFERGVHRAELIGTVRGEKLSLEFGLAPDRIDIVAPGWTAGGVRDGRLLADRLELVRDQPSASIASDAPVRVAIKPFVRVVRELDFDLDWTVLTRVQRVAPPSGGIDVRIPLIEGEQLLDGALKVVEGQVEIPLPPGVSEVEFFSRLERAETIRLASGEHTERAEVWRVRVGPSLSLQHQGVPVTEPQNGIDQDTIWVSEFHPLPGESLTLTLSRPAALPGASLVADAVRLQTAIGKRTRTHTLELSVRATQGGSHSIRLPENAELLSLTIDGQTLNLKPDRGLLGLPIRPGEQNVVLSWREDSPLTTWSSTPPLDLGMEAANLRFNLSVPADRWILGLSGPIMGPAVLYWASLAVLLALGVALGRSRRALLGTREWVLLVLGFSALSSLPLLLVIVAFVALDARERYLPGKLIAWQFALVQLLLAGLAGLAFIAIVVAVPMGLLGSPDMLIEGGGSAGSLSWLADRTTGELPTAGAISVSLWWYRALMLAFALWLAASLVRWLKRAWEAYSRGGFWPPPPTAEAFPRKPPQPQDSPPAGG